MRPTLDSIVTRTLTGSARFTVRAALGVATLATLTPPVATPARAKDPAAPLGAKFAGSVSAAAPRSQVEGNTEVRVMVELKEQPAAKVFAASVASGAQAADASAASVSHTARLESAQVSMLPALTGADIGAKVIFRVQKAFNGIALSVDPTKLDAIKALPNVKSVRPMIPQEMSGASSLNFLGTPSFWQKLPTRIQGQGIKVAVIDSGIDYLHTNFGGPGTRAAYQAGGTFTDPTTHAGFPSVKVVGGTDLVGDAYDANSTDPAVFTPKPDPDPMDTNGHGTACASIIGGYGVNLDGTTYGNGAPSAYTANIDPSTVRISPGEAPQVQLLAVRVFGTTGSTNVTTQAIEYAIDPHGDGSFRDRADVISMSLGSNYGFPDDDSAAAAQSATEVGVLVAAAAGNAYDHYYIASAPAAAPGGLSVAATYNAIDTAVYDGLVTTTAPTTVTYKGVFGQNSPQPNDPNLAHPATPSLTGKVVQAQPTIADTPLTNAAEIAGNIALIDRGTVSFDVKIKNAQNAGAIGVIMVQNTAAAPIVMGNSDPTLTIPRLMISQADGNALKTQIANGGATGAQASVSTGFSEVSTADGAGANTDTIPAYTSRGPSLGNNLLKPDVAAPAEAVIVARTQTGSQFEAFNGTSSATPHVAGELALIKQQHPSFSAPQVKALLMNTAVHDLTTVKNGTVKYGPGRVGIGRVDHTVASNDNVIAFDAQNPSLVSLSFGNVEVVGSTVQAKNVQVTNTGTTSQTYTVAYTPLVAVPGVTYTVGGSGTITVPAGGSTTFPVLLNADASAMKHSKEASVSATNTVGASAVPRHYLSEAAGYLTLTPTAGGTTEPAIRLSVHAIVKPASAMTTATTSLDLSAPTGTINVALTGTGVNTGGSTGGLVAVPDVLSLVKPFELQYVSPNLALTGYRGADDVQYLGVSSNYVAAGGALTTTIINFGLSTFGDANIPYVNIADREILIDSTGPNGVPDGVDDYVAYVNALTDAASAQPANVYVTTLLPLHSGLPLTASSSKYFFNRLSAQVDTNVFNNSVAVMSVNAADLGLTAGKTRFNYRVNTFDRTGALVDNTGTVSFDIAAPGVDAEPVATANGTAAPVSAAAPFYADLPGTSIPVAYNAANLKANGSQGLLLLHLHNQAGNRAQALVAGKPTITSFTPTQGPVGTPVTITGTNFVAGQTTVKFVNDIPATITAFSTTSITVTVPPGALTGTIRVETPAGAANSRGKFKVTP